MIKRSFRQSCLLACSAVVAGFFLVAPFALSAARPPRQVELHANLQDTGRTMTLAVGQQLIVTLPLQPYDDNTWYVARNSGGVLKLTAGPDERRPRNWTPWTYSSQVFYFTRESPGTAHLELEQRYWSKPMVLKVVDP